MTRAYRAATAASVFVVGIGWSSAETAGVATELADAYGVSLAAAGVLTTMVFVTHAGLQLPSGRAADRFGARRIGVLGASIVAIANAVALIEPDFALALAMRVLMGVGTALGFVAGSEYVRAATNSPIAQGLYGAMGLAGGGLALVLVPSLESAIGWHAPWTSGLLLGLLGVAMLAVAPIEPDRHRLRRRADHSLFNDRALLRLAGLYAGSYGLSALAANWVVTLLARHGADNVTAGAVGSLVLLTGIGGRLVGGWIVRAHRGHTHAVVLGCFVAGTLGSALLAAVPASLVLSALACTTLGVAAGVPFSYIFTGAAHVRPDAPAGAIGVVNMFAILLVLVGTPLVGLTFSLPSNGQLGFLAIACAWLGGVALAAKTVSDDARESPPVGAS